MHFVIFTEISRPNLDIFPICACAIILLRAENVEVKMMIFFERYRKNRFRSIVQIKGEVRIILGKEVFYRLYEVRRSGARRYAINVSGGGESSAYYFGTEKLAAVEMFDVIVAGLVTPCSLKYVAEDFSGGRAKMLK